MKKKKAQKQAVELVIYQARNGKIEFRGDFKHETLWATQQQIADVFDIERSVVTKHIGNILKDKEIVEKSNVQKMHFTHSDKPVKLYSLDIILAVGYRANSSQAIQFRIWATKILKQHLLEGFTINKKQISKNYEHFLQAVAQVKAVLPKNDHVSASNVLELVNAFAVTWFSLDAYDTESFPKAGVTKKQVTFTAEELSSALAELKAQLIKKKEATKLFGQERTPDAVQGIVGNVLQSFGGKDLYPTVEQKAAHLLYFIVKNHPFTDGNKRSGAFAFVWFLRKTGLLRASLTPEALTVLTLLVAESNPKDKEKIVGLVLLLLQKK